MPEIVAVATALPPHRVSSADTKRYLSDYLPSGMADRYRRIVDATRIRDRYTVMPMPELMQLRTIQERNDAYGRHAPGLAADVAVRALASAGPEQSRATSSIVSASCTGYMMPSIDAQLLGGLGLSKTVRRIPLTELGCSAGVAALGISREMLIGSEGASLIVTVELSSLGVQLAEPSTADMFANLLFSDGAAAAVVSREERGFGPAIVASRTHLWEETTGDLGMRLTDWGFRLVLSARLPRLIEGGLRAITESFLHDAGVGLDDVDFWVVHPGGPKILAAVASALQLSDQMLAPTWATWEDAGNLSSATVFFVLEQLARSTPPPAGALGVMLAFGPGVSCELVLLRSAGWLTGSSPIQTGEPDTHTAG